MTPGVKFARPSVKKGILSGDEPSYYFPPLSAARLTTIVYLLKKEEKNPFCCCQFCGSLFWQNRPDDYHAGLLI